MIIGEHTLGTPFFLKKNNPNGFTLTEILIAIFIFAVVMSILLSSFNASLSTTENVHGGMTTAEMAKNCMNRMLYDLQSLYLNLPPSYTPPGFDTPPDLYRREGDTTSINGIDFSKLRFTSSAHLSFGYSEQWEGIAEIVYYVHETEMDSLVMRRADNLYPYELFEENENDPVLCEKIKSLVFKYYDKEGTDYDNWDSESPDFKYATPQAISITLEIGDEDSSQIFQTKLVLPVYRDKVE